MFISEKVRKYLLSVARSTIASKLGIPEDEMKMPGGKDAKILSERRGVFVTLGIGGRLRGCIGHIEGVLPLGLGVRENAESAAFGDPRFDPLTKEEFADTDIEISVLSVPEKLEFEDLNDLKSKLRVGVDGVVLSKGFAKATYLPQVWENFEQEMGDGVSEDELKERFLDSLCTKAGLSSKDGLVIETYQAEVL